MRRRSFTSVMWGLSPAACVRYITVTAETYGIERTVAGFIQGVPSSLPKPSHSLTHPHLKGAYGVEIYLRSSTPLGASPAYVPIPHLRSGHTPFLNGFFLWERGLCWPINVALHQIHSRSGKRHPPDQDTILAYLPIYHDWLRLINIYVGTVAFIHNIPRHLLIDKGRGMVRASMTRNETKRTRKKGKAKDVLVDLTTNRWSRHRIWISVKRCIFI
jgi:hypothetical protein